MWLLAFWMLTTYADERFRFYLAQSHPPTLIEQSAAQMIFEQGGERLELRINRCNRPLINFYLQPFKKVGPLSLQRRRILAIDQFRFAEQAQCPSRSLASEIADSVSTPVDEADRTKNKFSSQMDLCIDSICAGSKGKVPDLPSRQSFAQRLSQDQIFRREFDVEVLPQIQTVLGAQAQRRNEVLGRALNALQRADRLARVDRLDLMRSLVGQIASDFHRETKTDPGGVEYEFVTGNKFKRSDYDPIMGSPDPLTAHLTTAQEQFVITYLNARNRLEAQSFADAAKRDSIERLDQLTPGPTLNQAAHRLAQNLLALQAQQRRRGLDSNRFNTNTDFTALKKIARGSDVDEISTATLKDARADIVRNQLDFENPTLAKQLDLLWREIKKSPALSEIVREKLNREKSTPWTTEYMMGKVDICRASYAYAIGSAPTSGQNQKALKMADGARQSVIDHVLPSYSTLSGRRLRDLLRSVRFILPPTREQAKQDYLDQIKTYAERTPELLNDDNPLQSFCFAREFSARALRDETLPTTDRVFVSVESVLYPDIGRQILAHEMGHQISAEFKRKNLSAESTQIYDRTRKCLADQHRFEEGPPDRFVEEDHADLISARAFPNSQVETWCMAQGGKHSFELNASKEDPHSGFLFRLLHMHQIAFGSLPPTCLDALREAGQNVQFHDCLQTNQIKAPPQPLR